MRGHESHARAVWNEIADDWQRAVIGRENVRVTKPGFILEHFLSLLCSRPDDSVDRTHGRYTVFIADAILEKSIANLPRKNTRILLFVLFDFRHHFWCRNFGLASSYHTRFDGPCFKIPTAETGK